MTGKSSVLLAHDCDQTDHMVKLPSTYRKSELDFSKDFKSILRESFAPVASTF